MRLQCSSVPAVWCKGSHSFSAQQAVVDSCSVDKRYERSRGVMNKERNGRKYYQFFICWIHLLPLLLIQYFTSTIFLSLPSQRPKFFFFSESKSNTLLSSSSAAASQCLQLVSGYAERRWCRQSAGFVLHRRQDHHRLPPLSWGVSWAVAAVSGVVTHTGCCWSSEVLAEINEIVT